MYSIYVKLDFIRENSINIFSVKYKHGRFLKKEKNVYLHSSDILRVINCKIMDSHSPEDSLK